MSKNIYEVVVDDGNRKTNHEFTQDMTIADILNTEHFKPVEGSVAVKSWKSGELIPVTDNQIRVFPLDIYPYVWVGGIRRISIVLKSQSRPKKAKTAATAENADEKTDRQ